MQYNASPGAVVIVHPEHFIPASRQILLRHKLDVSIEVFHDLLVVFAGSAVEDEGCIT